MNIFELMSLNKHGDYQEVLFTSALSYLFNPTYDHNLGIEFLNEFINDLVIENNYALGTPTDVISEFRLDNNLGNIDILIEYDDLYIGVEAKIWDRSANNKSSDDNPQLNRYCQHFENRNKKWKIIYLIPNESSKICIDAYNKLDSNQKKNVKLMAWSYSSDSLLPNFFLERSVIDVINEFYISRKRSTLHPQALWIIDSLYDFIPNLTSQIKDTTRFPSKFDLQKLEKTWPIFESFFEYFAQWPNPLHTAVGIPYGKAGNSVEFHKNSLFRIRTTKNYYSKVSDKEEFLPSDYIEIEFWDDVFNEIENHLKFWMHENNIPMDFLTDGYHIDADKKDKVKVLRIDSVLSNETIGKLDGIVRLGFSRIL